MPKAALPGDETDRIAALRALDIVGTERQAEFDIYPGLASKLFRTPIAAISLVDSERQWFKASVGLEVTETPRNVSFCAHAILDPTGILYVPDATKDPRFADNDLVVGDFGLRFYAGCPIIGPGDQPVGAICIIDREPRTFEANELEQLRQFALGVGGALKLHASMRATQQRAHIDALTGSLNRAGFEARLRSVFEERRDEPDRTSGLLLLDLDRFRSVNDLFGHAGGDKALLEVARRLREAVRSDDAVGRFGGDEFAVFVQDLQESELIVLAQRVHALLAKPFKINRQVVPLRASIGIGLCRGNAVVAEELISEADRALSKAKRAGRGTTRLAGGHDGVVPGRSGVGRIRMEETLRQALIPAGREPFALALQPLFDGQVGHLTGFEALVRWPRPNGQVLTPDEFIPVAESTGLVVELDRWVLDEACRLAMEWPGDLTISSNLSAANFFAGGLVETVKSVLRKHGLAPERLRLEVTESVLLHGRNHVQSLVSELRGLGVKIVLDDFGSGHASLAYLRDFRFDGLKIDRSFVHALETDPQSRALIQAMIDMGRALGMQITAEGIETSGQLRHLRKIGVTTVQGFFLGRPMAPRDALRLIGSSMAKAG